MSQASPNVDLVHLAALVEAQEEAFASVRRWTVRLAGDPSEESTELAEQLSDLLGLISEQSRALCSLSGEVYRLSQPTAPVAPVAPVAVTPMLAPSALAA